MANHNLLGIKGEQLAQSFLKQLGYSIIEVNWREQKFEIDIIAIDGNEIVFVEVKTRGTAIFGDPEEAVNQKKQNHLIEGAECYVNEHNIDLEGRFDVVSIILNANQEEIKHIKNAFYPEV